MKSYRAYDFRRAKNLQIVSQNMTKMQVIECHLLGITLKTIQIFLYNWIEEGPTYYSLKKREWK